MTDGKTQPPPPPANPVLPHPEVAQYFRNKGQDYERWIGGMQKMYARHAEGL